MPTFGQRPVRQVFLTLRSGSYVVVIGSSVQRGQTKSSIESLLARIAASFRAM
jgi:ABC-type taurine transport system ATPase subunit